MPLQYRVPIILISLRTIYFRYGYITDRFGITFDDELLHRKDDLDFQIIGVQSSQTIFPF